MKRRKKKWIIHFAANKKHIGLYPGPEAVLFFAEKLDQAGWKYSKGSIQIPYSDELPLDLISEKAVRSFQTKADLESDGEIGADT